MYDADGCRSRLFGCALTMYATATIAYCYCRCRKARHAGLRCPTDDPGSAGFREGLSGSDAEVGVRRAAAVRHSSWWGSRDRARVKAAQARAVYDRIGRAQDWQFYQDRAVARLLTDRAPPTAHAVFEFGCGTGRLAVRMLEVAPPTARYLGVDVSPVMVGLAANRLAVWGDRALDGPARPGGPRHARTPAG